MRGGLGGFFLGLLALSLLEVVVSSSEASGRVGGALTGASLVFRHIIDPAVPAIPDLRVSSGATTSSSTPTPSAAAAPSAVATVLPFPGGSTNPRLPVSV
jgi:hypothetical protein